jgi:hypothetical protein
MAYFSGEHSFGSPLGCGAGCNCGPCSSGMNGFGQRYEAEEKNGLSFGYYGGFYGDEPAEAPAEPAVTPEQKPPEPEPRPSVTEPRTVEADQNLVHEAISRGIRGPRRLTDIVFFARHPTLKENPSWANDGALLDEWRQIRDRLVAPLVRQRFAPRRRMVRYRRVAPRRFSGPPQYGFGYFAAPPLCNAARTDLQSISFDIQLINNELKKGAGGSATRMALKKKLLELDVDGMIGALNSYIASGCCEPALKTLESEVKALPWPLTVITTKAKLVGEIVAAQLRARKDFQHC